MNSSLSSLMPLFLAGFVFSQRHMLEVHPLTDRLQDVVNSSKSLSLVLKHELVDAQSHFQKRLSLPSLKNLITKRGYHNRARYTVELALFLDYHAYSRYRSFFNYNQDEINDFLICYVNGIDALYKIPSLGGHFFDFCIKRIEIWTHHPSDVVNTDEVNAFYESFCSFQMNLNSKDENDLG